MKENNNFYGIPKIEFIFRGAYNDPEVKYKGKLFNYYVLEDTLYSQYKEDGYTSDDDFEAWVKGNKHLAYDCLDTIILNRGE